MPPCQSCGRPAYDGRLCVACGAEAAMESRPTPTAPAHECPDCGGETSGEDVTCRHCRRDGPGPVLEGER